MAQAAADARSAGEHYSNRHSSIGHHHSSVGSTNTAHNRASRIEPRPSGGSLDAAVPRAASQAAALHAVSPQKHVNRSEGTVSLPELAKSPEPERAVRHPELKLNVPA